MHSDNAITVDAAVQAMAMVGDLSMGQPTDQSMRAARLAQRIALLDGAGAEAAAHARLVSLLRWSGCTANAAGFATLLGDDVGGRDAMLRHALPPDHPLTPTTIEPLARIHCEVAGALANMLGLPSQVEEGLRHVWEHHDGSGAPQGLRAPAIPQVVYYTSLAGDLEILARTHDPATALRMIQGWSEVKYPARLATLALNHAAELLAALEQPESADSAPATPREVPLTIVADMIELKLPWLTGYSRRVADLAARAGAQAGLPPEQQRKLARAALVHGIGRASVPNTVWERPGQLGSADWEKIRLAPYWTARAGALVPALLEETRLASHLYERADGSGYFRSLEQSALGLPQRLLAAAGAHAALCAARPWRAAMSAPDAARLLQDEAAAGRFCADAVGLVITAAGGEASSTPVRRGLLSEREAEVLKRISLGESNKEAARVMQISPSTVRTHIESIFRKLECSTRAAATLKALNLGLI